MDRRRHSRAGAGMAGIRVEEVDIRGMEGMVVEVVGMGMEVRMGEEVEGVGEGIEIVGVGRESVVRADVVQYGCQRKWQRPARRPRQCVSACTISWTLVT